LRICTTESETFIKKIVDVPNVVYDKITILQEGKEPLIVAANGPDILATLLKIPASYLGSPIECSCRHGICGWCRVELVEGGVKYHNDKIGHTRDKQILPCSCLPDGDIVIQL